MTNNQEAVADNETTRRQTGCIGARHWQCILLFLGITIGYVNRVCMSIAVVAIEDILKITNDEDKNGYILSSFFWGYTIMQIPSGHLARIWSARRVLEIGILMNGILSILCPLAFDSGGWLALCFCRGIMGLFQACLLPCVHTLLAKWVPPSERGLLCTTTYAGAQFGTVISYPIAGFLTDAAGWRSVFYLAGASAVIWSMIFFFIGSDSPSESANKTFCGISENERNYIEIGLGVNGQAKGDVDDKKRAKTPWGAILTSLPFWSLVIVHCGQNWGFWTLITETSLYMQGVLKFDIKENGLKSALPYLVMLLLTVPMSWLSDFAQRKGISRGLLRKICNTIGHWGPAAALVGLCFVTPGNTDLPVVLLVVAGGLNVGAICGFQINHMDLSPNYAGLLMAFTNCAGGIMSLLAPLIASRIVIDSENPEQWKIVFYIAGGFYFFGNLIFIIFGSGETQWWDDYEKVKEKNDGTVIKSKSNSDVESDAAIL